MESFASKVRDSSQTKDGRKSGSSKGEHSSKSKSSGRSSAAESSFDKNTAGAEKSVTKGRTVNSQSLHPGKVSSPDAKLPRGQMSKPVSILSLRSDQVQRQGTGKVHVVQPSNALKNSVRNSSPPNENSRDSIIDPDGRRGDENKQGKRRGAKNASSLTKMEASHSQQDIQVLEDHAPRESVSSASPQARSFLNLLTRSVLPRISYLDKHAKKIVRFAVDLPNNVKLGVRLEQSEGSLSICFICSDPESLEMLGFTKDALAESLSDQSGNHTRINVFNNYKEMDEHFSRAA